MADCLTCPYVLGSDKVCQSSIQSDNFIKNYRLHGRRGHDRQTDRQTDRHFRKNRFPFLGKQ